MEATPEESVGQARASISAAEHADAWRQWDRGVNLTKRAIAIIVADVGESPRSDDAIYMVMKRAGFAPVKGRYPRWQVEQAFGLTGEAALCSADADTGDAA